MDIPNPSGAGRIRKTHLIKVARLHEILRLKLQLLVGGQFSPSVNTSVKGMIFPTTHAGSWMQQFRQYRVAGPMLLVLCSVSLRRRAVRSR
jgi:hypothetical protein